MDELLTSRGLAARLGVRVETVRRWTRKGVLPCLKQGKIVRYQWDEVEAVLRKERDGGGR